MAAKLRVFLDSSALIAGCISSTGGAQAILDLAEAGVLQVMISRQVQEECERTLTNKAARALPVFRQILTSVQPEIQPDPSADQVKAAVSVIDTKDAPILAVAMASSADYVVTVDRKHFLAPNVAQQSGLRIGTPGDFLAWLREQTAQA
jgi:putative PIN family toxin of toxin-antitoxin system